MKKDASIRYWDSNCFLGWFMDEPDKQQACEGVVAEAQKGNLKIVTSAITFIEVIKLKSEIEIKQENENKISRFFENDFIIVQNVDRLMGELGRELIWKHGVSSRDAIHLATALYNKLTIFDTFDDKLIKLDGKLTNPVRLKIGKPDIPFQESMDNLLPKEGEYTEA